MKPSFVLYGSFLSSASLFGALLMLPLAGVAHAGDLDLSLPDSTRFGMPYTPPGAYSPEAGEDAAATDDGKAQIHGSFTTGIGYSKGLGSTTYNSAHINIGKTFGDEHPTRLNLDLYVEKIDGPGAGYGDGYDGVGPWPRRMRMP